MFTAHFPSSKHLFVQNVVFRWIGITRLPGHPVHCWFCVCSLPWTGLHKSWVDKAETLCWQWGGEGRWSCMLCMLVVWKKNDGKSKNAYPDVWHCCPIRWPAVRSAEQWWTFAVETSTLRQFGLTVHMYIEKNHVMWLQSYGYGCDAHRGVPPEGTFRLPFGRSCFRGPHYHVLLSAEWCCLSLLECGFESPEWPPLYLKILLAPRIKMFSWCI